MTSILIDNLYYFTLPDIVNIFSEYGRLESAALYKNYAVVTYTDFEDALTAIDHVNGQYINGRKLTVMLNN